MGKTILCLVVGHVVEEEGGTFFDDCTTHPVASRGSWWLTGHPLHSPLDIPARCCLPIILGTQGVPNPSVFLCAGL